MALKEFNEQEGNRWRLSFLRIIVFTTVILFSILIAIRFSQDWQFFMADIILLAIIVSFSILYIFAKRGFLALASTAIIIVALLAVFYLTYAGKGVFDSAAFGFVAVMIASYLLLGWRHSLFVVVISISWLWFLGWLTLSGRRTFVMMTPIDEYIRDITFILLIVAALSHFYLQRINNYIERLSKELAERNKAEQTLRVKEENYRYLFQQASEGILIGNEEGNIILANESMSLISGYSGSDLLGKSIAMK